VFFHRLGELRDRSFESQAYRASGLNLLVAAIILWNTKYLENTLHALRAEGQRVPNELVSSSHRPARMGTRQPHRRLYLEQV
jgi:TnpA family transposase